MKQVEVVKKTSLGSRFRGLISNIKRGGKGSMTLVDDRVLTSLSNVRNALEEEVPSFEKSNEVTEGDEKML